MTGPGHGDMYATLLVLALQKLNVDEVTITTADIQDTVEMATLVLNPHHHGITIRVIPVDDDDDEAIH